MGNHLGTSPGPHPPPPRGRPRGAPRGPRGPAGRLEGIYYPEGGRPPGLRPFPSPAQGSPERGRRGAPGPPCRAPLGREPPCAPLTGSCARLSRRQSPQPGPGRPGARTPPRGRGQGSQNPPLAGPNWGSDQPGGRSDPVSSPAWLQGRRSRGTRAAAGRPAGEAYFVVGVPP